jgi:hypothetical protein
MRKPTLSGCAATVIIALLLAGCGPDRTPGPGGGTATPTTGVTSTKPPDNGIAAKPVDEILAASERALRSARSVRVSVTFKDADGLLRGTFNLSRKRDMAGWIEQQGVRVDIVAVGGRFYLRSRKLWEQQGNAELAKLIGNRWVLVPRTAVGELMPFGNELTISGLANEIFRSKDTPRFIRKGRATVGRLPAVRLWAVDGSYYLAATGKPYPLLLDHAGDDQDLTFSHYDENPAIRAPRGALDLEKLEG